MVPHHDAPNGVEAIAKGLEDSKARKTKGQRSKQQLEEDEEDVVKPLSTSEVEVEVARVKWKVWHGQVIAALEVLEELDLDLEGWKGKPETARKLHQKVRELAVYLETNQLYIVNYGERYRNGERISTRFMESTMNELISKRFVKKQQMKWTKRGAHLLMQVRVQVADEKLKESFSRWYPAMAAVGGTDYEEGLAVAS